MSAERGTSGPDITSQGILSIREHLKKATGFRNKMRREESSAALIALGILEDFHQKISQFGDMTQGGFGKCPTITKASLLDAITTTSTSVAKRFEAIIPDNDMIRVENKSKGLSDSISFIASTCSLHISRNDDFINFVSSASDRFDLGEELNRWPTNDRLILAAEIVSRVVFPTVSKETPIS